MHLERSSIGHIQEIDGTKKRRHLSDPILFALVPAIVVFDLALVLGADEERNAIKSVGRGARILAKAVVSKEGRKELKERMNGPM